jgi:hypothetical protein
MTRTDRKFVLPVSTAKLWSPLVAR